MVVAARIEKIKTNNTQTKAGRAIEQFLRECQKRSEDTEINYRGDIRRFLDMVYDGQTIDTITLEELNQLDFDTFSEYVETCFEGLSNNTVNRHTSSIKALMKHLKARGLIKSNISYIDLITLLPNDSKRIERMPQEVFMRYIDEAGREKHNPLAKQEIIKLAIDTSLRLEDYEKMEWDQFSPQEIGEDVEITGYGKGNKRWHTKISYEVYEGLLKLKKNQDIDEKRVFAPLSRKNVSDMMLRFKEVLGYRDRRFSFHSFKKTAVTFTYRETGDLTEAMRVGQHSNVNTTLDYIEGIDYGVTGMFSLGLESHDGLLYKKASHEELLTALDELNKDTLFLLNLKLKKNMA